MFRTALLSLALLIALPVAAHAAPSVYFPGAGLAPNTANQVVAIYGVADEPIQGLDLYLEVVPNVPGAPIITNVNLVSGTIFEGNNFGQTDFAPLYMPPGTEIAASTATNSGFVQPGIVAFVTFDTTGTTPGFYFLELTHPVLGASVLYTQSGAASTAVGGPLFLPEPSSVVLAVCAAGFGALIVRKNRKRKSGER